MLSFMFLNYTYILFFFIHLIGFYVTFVISEFSNYNVMNRMHHDFPNIFSNFHIAELLLE